MLSFKDFLKNKKKEPTPRPYRTGKHKDSAEYKTDHHYAHGDIEPSDVPVYKATWQNMR